MNEITWQPGITLEEMEKKIIIKAFSFYDSNKTRTASALGIAIRTLDAKLVEYEKEKHAKDRHPQPLGPHTYRERMQLLKEQRIQNELDEGQQQRAENQKKFLSAGSEGFENGEPDDDGAEAGLHMEPPEEITEEHALPVQERDEVQAVPPQQTGNNSKPAGRGHNHKRHGGSRDSRVRG